MTHPSAWLGKLPVFFGLDSSELDALLNLCQLQQKKAAEVLCKEGEAADAMYVMQTGKVAVLKRMAQGDWQRIATLSAPTVLGEMAMIDGAPRSATLQVVETAMVYRIGVSEFEALRRAMHPAAYKMIKNLTLVLCERLRETNDRIDDFFASPEKSLRLMQARQKELWQQRQTGGGNG